ncbi:unnamed protein product, partial [Pylaiella littoralis]
MRWCACCGRSAGSRPTHARLQDSLLQYLLLRIGVTRKRHSFVPRDMRRQEEIHFDRRLILLLRKRDMEKRTRAVLLALCFEKIRTLYGTGNFSASIKCGCVSSQQLGFYVLTPLTPRCLLLLFIVQKIYPSQCETMPHLPRSHPRHAFHSGR